MKDRLRLEKQDGRWIVLWRGHPVGRWFFWESAWAWLWKYGANGKVLKAED